MAETPLVRVRDLSHEFDVSPPFPARLFQGRRSLKAVDGVSFDIARGETFALVGESGCGKSTVARLITGLHHPTRGTIEFDGVDVTRLRGRAAQAPFRRRIQMIFQDPYASLNPRWRIRDIVAEPIRTHRLVRNRREIVQGVATLLTWVGLSPVDGDKFPHQFSGGQRQRISIARGIASNPDFLICDEPTSALDVSVQAQILNLLKDLQRRYRLTYLLISHNLAVIYHMADRVAVMYLGRLVELADVESLFSKPGHPYTRMLLETVPDLNKPRRRTPPVTGEVPNPIDLPPGCAFHPRCPFADRRCRTERPELRDHDGALVACHAVEERRLSGSVSESTRNRRTQ